jgi:hypothetical protein
MLVSAGFEPIGDRYPRSRDLQIVEVMIGENGVEENRSRV